MTDDNAKDKQMPQNPAQPPDVFGQARQKLNDIRSRIPNIDNLPKQRPDLVGKVHVLLTDHALTHSDLNFAQGANDFSKLQEINSSRIPQLERQLNEIQQEQLSNFTQPQGISLNQIPQTAAIEYFKNPHDDPQIRETEKDIIRKTNQDPEVRKAATQGAATYKSAWNKANLKIKTQQWNNFMQVYPEKAELYRKIYSPIGDVYQTRYKLSRQWERINGKTRQITLENDPVYRKFLDNSDTGLAARLWKELPDKNYLSYSDFRQKTQEIRAELDKQFRLQYPEIAVRYKLLAEKQATLTREEREQRQKDRQSLEDFIKEEIEKGQDIYDKTKEAYEQTGAEAEKQLAKDLFEKNTLEPAEAPAQEIVEKVEVKEVPQSAPATRQPARPQIRTGAVDRVNRTIGRVRNVRSAAGKARSIASLGKTLRTGATGARAIGGALEGLGAIFGIGGGTVLIIIIATILVIIFIIILITFIFTALNQTQQKPGTQPSGTPVPTISVVPTPSTSPLPVGNISNCDFFRSDLNPPGAKYQSLTLMSYFQEAANASGVPAVVLAAFARIETPGSSAWITDSDLNTYQQKCLVSTPGDGYQSSTGALGVMQIQPLGTTGSDINGITLGASYFGVSNPWNLITADYCDIRKNILLGAGVINKKASYINSPPGGAFDTSQMGNRDYFVNLGGAYYGCKGYNNCVVVSNTSSCSDRTCRSGGLPTCCQYSYGGDVFQSVSNCNVVPPPANIRQDIQNRFGIMFVDGTGASWDYTHLTWAWQKLLGVSTTKFISLVTGTTITAIPGGAGSAQTGCTPRSIDLALYSTEELFKLILTHELGHIIRNCEPASNSYFQAHLAIYPSQETGVTYYANNAYACTGSDPASEDYAEMIAYILNPNSPSHTASCVPPGSPNPFANCPGTSCVFPLHYNLAKTILGIP